MNVIITALSQNNQAIESLGTERSSDREPRNGAIKRSRTIFTDQNSWSRSQTRVCDYPL